jgi:hypothetical protein
MSTSQATSVKDHVWLTCLGGASAEAPLFTSFKSSMSTSQATCVKDHAWLTCLGGAPAAAPCSHTIYITHVQQPSNECQVARVAHLFWWCLCRSPSQLSWPAAPPDWPGTQQGRRCCCCCWLLQCRQGPWRQSVGCKTPTLNLQPARASWCSKRSSTQMWHVGLCRARAVERQH